MKTKYFSFLTFFALFSLFLLPIFSTEEIYPKNDKKVIRLRIANQFSAECNEMNGKGLEELRISGSAQFSKKNLEEEISQSLPVSIQNLTVVDLRQESHGYINDVPVSWSDGKNGANKGKTLLEIELDEKKRLTAALQAGEITLDPYENPILLNVQEVQLEREIVENLGAKYIRLPVTDHYHPSDEIIDQLIKIIRETQPEDWFHFHCRAGAGRTTTFLALFDIAKNASLVSLEDILKRQKVMGGYDLSLTSKKTPEKSERAQNRLNLIQAFYLYCQETPDFQLTWSEWKKGRNSN